jgi:hypothetical protein
MTSKQSSIQPFIASALLSTQDLNQLVDLSFENMRADYRVNRFFNNQAAEQQLQSLKELLHILAQGGKWHENLELIDEVFTELFARNNAKPSLVSGRDFAFLLDVIGGRDLQVITPICLCHQFLLKLQPDDFHVDVLIEHVQTSLHELMFNDDSSQQVLSLVESARDVILGRVAPSAQA